jgi:phosphohistidine phosphatase
MKTIIFTRHAKSDWGQFNQIDFDRELNQRGLHDASLMGKRLLQQNLGIDLVVSSKAKRADQTTVLICEQIHFSKENIVWSDTLYHSPPHIIAANIMEQNNKYNTMLVVCHNPGITEYINLLIGYVTSDMPTCAMCAIKFETDKWSDIQTAKARVLFYDYPKS